MWAYLGNASIVTIEDPANVDVFDEGIKCIVKTVKFTVDVPYVGTGKCFHGTPTHPQPDRHFYMFSTIVEKLWVISETQSSECPNSTRHEIRARTYAPDSQNHARSIANKPPGITGFLTGLSKG